MIFWSIKYMIIFVCLSIIRLWYSYLLYVFNSLSIVYSSIIYLHYEWVCSFNYLSIIWLNTICLFNHFNIIHVKRRVGSFKSNRSQMASLWIQVYKPWHLPLFTCNWILIGSIKLFTCQIHLWKRWGFLSFSYYASCHGS